MKSGFFFAVEFGRYGWGRTPKATLPHMRGFGLVRVSWGACSIDRGILRQMAAEGALSALPKDGAP